MKKKRRLQKADRWWLSAVGLLLLLQFWWLPGDPGTPSDSFSNSVEGQRGLFLTLDRLAEQGMLPPVKRETQKLVPERSCTLLLLSPDRYPDAHEQQQLYEFVVNGGSLVLAPNWQDPDFSIASLGVRMNRKYFSEEDTAAAPSLGTGNGAPTDAQEQDGLEGDPTPESQPQEPDAANKAKVQPAAKDPKPPIVAMAADERQIQTEPGTQNEEPRELLEESIDPQQNSLSPAPTASDSVPSQPEVSNLQTDSRLIEHSVPWRTRASLTPRFDSEALVQTAGGTVQVASWRLGSGLVVASASADVFSNRALLDPQQAELAVRIVEHASTFHAQATATPIVVNEFLNSSQAYRGTGVLLGPSLRSGTLQLITIAVLAGWFGFHRFGPPHRTETNQRRSLSESAIAVGNLQFRSESGSEMVRAYLDFLRAQLRQMFGAAIQLKNSTVIAQRAGLSQEEVERRISTAEQSLNNRLNPARAAVLIRDLADLLNRLHGRH